MIGLLQRVTHAAVEVDGARVGASLVNDGPVTFWLQVKFSPRVSTG